MPAKDHYHDAVKRALIKDGWTIDREQITFVIEGRQVQIDLQSSRQAQATQRTIFVEVKSFLRRSPVEDLAAAIGKYQIYRAVLDEANLEDTDLYLAIPEAAYDTIFTERLGIMLRE